MAGFIATAVLAQWVYVAFGWSAGLALAAFTSARVGLSGFYAVAFFAGTLVAFSTLGLMGGQVVFSQLARFVVERPPSARDLAEQEARSEKRQGEERRRVALSHVYGELNRNLSLLRDSRDSGYYWNPNDRNIDIKLWLNHRRTIAGAGLMTVYKATDEAYDEVQRMAYIAGERHRLQSPRVEINDKIDRAISRVESALAELDKEMEKEGPLALGGSAE
jgi:hypothetical protein